MERIIFLTGFPGCGKTTMGEALAARHRVRFVDLDRYIEERAGLTVAEIFARYGEDTFREMERRALGSIAGAERREDEPVVVACGGGTPCHADNMALMNSRGVTVWLTATEERLYQRLAAARSERPHTAGLSDTELRSYISATLKERTPYYAQARHRFDATYLDTPEELDRTVGAFINEYLDL